MDLTSALTMQGYLQKQSPSMLKLFQSRYFAIRGKGQFLVWFKKKPVNPDQNPQGIINIDTINDVKQSDDEKIFQVSYLSRNFTLRAQTEALKQRWVESLRTILTYHQKLNKNRKKQLENTNQSWKWNNISNKQLSQQIRLQNQQVILQDGEDHKGNLNEIMLNHVFQDKAHEPDLEKCIVSGFYQKKGLLKDSNRWFLLISQINLFDDNDEQLYSSIPEILSTLKKQSKPPQQSTAVETEKKRKRKVSTSSDDSQEQKMKKKKQQTSKQIITNVLYEYDEQTKTLKHSYNLLNFIDFQVITNERPFNCKIFYQQTVNQEEEQMKEIELILMNNFLLEIKKLYHALNIIFQRFAITKQRQKMLNTRSKRYKISKWRFESQQSWLIPQKATQNFCLLLNQTTLKLNMVQIALVDIEQHKYQTFKAKSQQQKDCEGYFIKYRLISESDKQKKQSLKLCLIFKDKDSMKKFTKKLLKNVKRVQQQYAQKNKSKKVEASVEQPKKINPDTYLIDKKVRQTQSGIKVNFYDLMEREIITEKNEGNNNKNSGFFASISAFFCATGSPLDAD